MKQASHHGKGMIETDHLLPVDDQPEIGKVAMLNVSDIQPNPNQPRKNFDKEKMAELSKSIAVNRDEKGGYAGTGLLQPISVRLSTNPKGAKYEIIAGERRWQSFVNSRYKQIPAIVYDMDATTSLQIAIVENLQREDLTQEELGMACAALHDSGMTYREIAKAVGKTASQISDSINLIKMPNDIRELVREKPTYVRDITLLSRISTTKRAPIIANAIRGQERKVVIEKARTALTAEEAFKRQNKTPEVPVMPSHPLLPALDSIDHQLSKFYREVTIATIPKKEWAKMKTKLAKLKQHINDIAEVGNLELD